MVGLDIRSWTSMERMQSTVKSLALDLLFLGGFNIFIYFMKIGFKQGWFFILMNFIYMIIAIPIYMSKRKFDKEKALKEIGNYGKK